MTAPRKPGRPIRGASRLVSRAYRLEEGTIATIERLATDLGLSHAQVVARAVEVLAGSERPGQWELDAVERRGRLESLGEALAEEHARQSGAGVERSASCSDGFHGVCHGERRGSCGCWCHR